MKTRARTRMRTRRTTTKTRARTRKRIRMRMNTSATIDIISTTMFVCFLFLISFLSSCLSLKIMFYFAIVHFLVIIFIFLRILLFSS